MRKMDELAISPDYNTFHILIKYFCKEKLYMLAYQTMEDMHRKGHQPAEVCLFFIFNQLSSIYSFGLFLIQLEGFNVSDIELDIIMQKHKCTSLITLSCLAR